MRYKTISTRRPPAGTIAYRSVESCKSGNDEDSGVAVDEVIATDWKGSHTAKAAEATTGVTVMNNAAEMSPEEEAAAGRPTGRCRSA